MSSKKPKDIIVWQVDGCPLSIELYKSKIIIRDENGNKIKVTKKEPLSIILDLVGSFKTNNKSN
jgi:hypothetical protein